MAKNRSRTNSVSSKVSNDSTSKQQLTLSKSDSLASTVDKTNKVSLQVPTLVYPHTKLQKTSKNVSIVDGLNSESKLQTESELFERHSHDLNFSEKTHLNNHRKQKVDFTFDDVTITEDVTDMTPTKDSTFSRYDMSTHADRAANLLIKVIQSMN